MNSVKLQDTVNIQNLLFVYTNNELPERESKKKNPLYNGIKKNKTPKKKTYLRR